MKSLRSLVIILHNVFRFGLYLGCKVYFIKEGYQGMIDGGDNIIEASWSDVSGIIHRGGTVIGSARCMVGIFPLHF